MQGAAKKIFAPGFVFHNVENGKCRCFFASESNLILERSHLIANKEDRLLLQFYIDDSFLFGSEYSKRTNINWRVRFTTNVTAFAASLKSVPFGYEAVLLPSRFVTRTDVNCLAYKAKKQR